MKGGRIRTVLVGTGWFIVGTSVAQLAQLAYATFTSRLVSPAEFGSYAVALTVMGLINIVARGGLDDATARLATPSREDLRGLANWSALLGVACGGLVWLTAGVWGRVFGDQDASGVVRMMAVAVAFTPFFALVSGVARQQGRFRQWTLASIGWTLIGLLLGLSVVRVHPTGAVLTIPAIVLAVGMTLGHRAFTDYWVIPGRAALRPTEHVRFGTKVSASALLEYAGLLACQVAISRGVSVTALGQWNRASAFAVVPIWALVQALTRALFPELGERWDRARGGTTLAATLYLTTWLGMVGAVWWGGAVAMILPTVIGTQWQLAATLAVPLALTAGLALAAAPAVTALQAGDEFPSYFRIQRACLAIMLLGAAGTALSASLIPVAIAYPLSGILRLALVRRDCHRLDLLQGSGPWPRTRRAPIMLMVGLMLVLVMTLRGVPSAGFLAAAAGAVAISALSIVASVLLWRDDRTRAALQTLTSPTPDQIE